MEKFNQPEHYDRAINDVISAYHKALDLSKKFDSMIKGLRACKKNNHKDDSPAMIVKALLGGDTVEYFGLKNVCYPKHS